MQEQERRKDYEYKRGRKGRKWKTIDRPKSRQKKQTTDGLYGGKRMDDFKRKYKER